MHGSDTGPIDESARSAYVIRYVQSFDTALEAGHAFQARTLSWYYALFGVGITIGAVVGTRNLTAGLSIAFFCALMILTTRFAVMDRLFGRRRVRSVLDRTIELTFRDDGIIWNGPQATSHIPWTSITEVRANARMVLFIRDRLLLAYAPAAAFASEGEQAEVVAYARRHIDAAKASGDIGAR